jgi:hypothetical protein
VPFAIAVGFIIDVVLLRRRVNNALAHTTAGARPSEPRGREAAYPERIEVASDGAWREAPVDLVSPPALATPDEAHTDAAQHGSGRS